MFTLKRTVTTLTLLLPCLATPAAQADAPAGIVGDVTGEIDLMLDPFFDTGPIWNEELQQDEWLPIGPVHQITPVGKDTVQTTFDGGGQWSTGGDTRFNYEYLEVSPTESWFTFYAYALTEDAGDGGGGYSQLNMQVTFDYPVHYRLAADANGFPMSYNVSFNGEVGSAHGGGYGIRGGTFPLLWIYEDGVPVYAYDFDTYIDQGVLPAGTYEMSVQAFTGLHRYGIGLSSSGSAQLHVTLLGDADQDGVVGIDDLDAVLDHWAMEVPDGVSQFGDLDGDGIVGLSDLDQVLLGWGSDLYEDDDQGDGLTTVPEPATAGLLIALGMSLLTRRH